MNVESETEGVSRERRGSVEREETVLKLGGNENMLKAGEMFC